MVSGFVPFSELESFLKTLILAVIFALTFSMRLLLLSVLSIITLNYIWFGVC